jgi:hypothetical protein
MGGRLMSEFVGWGLIALGFVLDLIGTACGVHSVYRDGPSGIPVIPALCYASAAFLIDTTCIGLSTWQFILAGIALHVLLQFGVVGLFWFVHRISTKP